MRNIESYTARRNALKKIGLISTAGLFGLGGLWLNGKGTRPVEDPLCLFPTSVPTVQGDTGDMLRATAISVDQQSNESSFVPEGKFTEILFEKVRKGTFVIRLLLRDETGVPCHKGFGGTAWCAKKEGNTIYIATNRHIVDAIQHNVKLTQMDIWRPFIDREKIELSNIRIASSKERDLAVIKATILPRHTRTIHPLEFLDNYALSQGEHVLIAGYPKQFREIIENSHNYPTAAEVISASHEQGTQSWSAYGHIDHGSSGSPVVIPGPKDTPQVVGIVRGFVPFDFHGERILGGPMLEVNSLIKRLR